MTPKQTITVVILIALVALGAHAVTADDAVPAPVAVTLASGETVNVVPGDWVKAGDPYPALDPTIANVQAQLGGGWTWEGNVGTYVDNCTRVELVAGPPLDVRVLRNCGPDAKAVGIIARTVPDSRLTDACLRAQLLLGTTMTMDETVAVCETSDQ